jgi:surface polysaccharide O-acyltransferase-like enzyme
MINERIYYIDILKFIAIFGVIFIHMCGFAGHSEVLHYKITGFSEIFRFSVPIFLMITGTLLLNRDISINSFLKKRFSRIVYPYVFWIILAIITFLYVSGTLIQDYPIVILDQFFNISWNWYFWMIIGVYLAIPIINEFVINKKLEGCKYFIILMIIASVYYSICYFLGYKTSLDLRFFILPIAYVVLGYFLANYDFNISKNKLILISLILFISVTLLKLMFNNTTIFFLNDNIFFNSGLDISILEIIQASSLFMIFKNLNYNLSNEKHIKTFITSVSRSSYGMYLSHMIILIPLYQYFKKLSLTGSQTLSFVIVSSICIFLITWIVVLLVNRFSYKFSGYY